MDVQDTGPSISGWCSYIVIGSRVCKPCNVLNVQYVSMYVFSIIQGYTIPSYLKWTSYSRGSKFEISE